MIKTKEELEREKLELEIINLRRPAWWRKETYAWLIPLLCVLVAYSLNFGAIRQALDLDSRILEKKKIELNIQLIW